MHLNEIIIIFIYLINIETLFLMAYLALFENRLYFQF